MCPCQSGPVNGSEGATLRETDRDAPLSMGRKGCDVGIVYGCARDQPWVFFAFSQMIPVLSLVHSIVGEGVLLMDLEGENTATFASAFHPLTFNGGL